MEEKNNISLQMFYVKAYKVVRKEQELTKQDREKLKCLTRIKSETLSKLNM